MANFLDDLSTYNAKAALAISNAVAAGDTQRANMMNSLKSTANDTTLTEAVRLNALTALVNIGMLLDIPLPPYFPSVVTYNNAPVYQGIHNDLDGLQGGQTGEYFHLTQAQFNNLANAATLADINFAQLGGSYTQNSGLNTAINSKQDILNGTGFVKVSGTTVSYDNSTYLTASTGIVSGASFGGQVSGTYNALTLSNDAVIGKLLTNWNPNVTYSAITDSDSILSGMEKLNARINGLVNNPSGVSSAKLATNASDVFTVTTTAQTGAASLNVNLNTQNSNLFLASSSTANNTQPAFRAIANSDLPTSGVGGGVYGTTTKIPVITVNNRGIVTSVTEVTAAAGGGQVDSVAMSVPSSGTIYTASSSGTTNVTVGFTVVAQSPNTVYAGPSSGSSSVVPGFRPLVLADIANIVIPQSQVAGLEATLRDFLRETDLSDNTIWIGSSSNSAVPRKLSGDVTATNEGVTAIGAKKVTFEKFQDITAKKLLGNFTNVTGSIGQITLSGDFVLSDSGTLSLQNPVAPIVTTKGDLLSWTAATNTQGRFPSSNTDGDILMVLNAAAGDFGLKWTTVSGDISVTNASAGTFSIGANKVTFAKMQTIASGTILGNNTGSTAVPSDLNGTQATALLNQFTSDGTGGNAGLKGLVPPGNITLPSGKFLTDYVLTAAGSWVAAAGSGSGTVSSSTPGRVAYYTGATTVDGLAFDGPGLVLKTNATNDGLEWDTAGSGSGTVNSGVVNALAYYSTSPTGTTVDNLAPPTTNGQYFLRSKVTASVSALPDWVLAQTAMNALAGAATSGSYLRGDGTDVVMSPIQAGDVPTLNQNTTGTAANITATSNSTLTTLNALSLPGSQVSGNIPGSAANVTGTVAVGNGGTGATTFTANGVLYGNTTSAVQATAAGATGTVLVGTNSSAPSFSATPSLTSLTLGVASTTAGDLILRNATNANTQTIRGTNYGSNITYLWPSGVPAAGNVLSASAPASGVITLSWASAGAATIAIGSTVTSGTTGSVLFVSSGQLQQSNANFYWDNSTFRLGIGTATPAGALSIRAGVGTGPQISLTASSLSGSFSAATNGNMWYDTTGGNSSLNIYKDSGYTKFITLDRNPDLATSGTALLQADSNGTISRSGELTALGIYAQTNTPTAITTGSGSLIGTVTGVTALPANFFGTGKTIAFYLSGLISMANSGGPVVAIDFRITDGTTTVTLGTLSYDTTNLTNRVYVIDTSITCRSSGSNPVFGVAGKMIVNHTAKNQETVFITPAAVTATSLSTSSALTLQIVATWTNPNTTSSISSIVNYCHYLN
jgi:hypothetical protein